MNNSRKTTALLCFTALLCIVLRCKGREVVYLHGTALKEDVPEV
jgi:hypothetical protein